MKPCRHLEHYLDNRLSSDARQRFEDHLSRCATCREETAIWNEIVSVIEENGRALIAEQSMTPLRDTHAASGFEPNRLASTTVPVVIKWASAAVVLAVLAVVFLLLGESSDDRGAARGGVTPVSFTALYFGADTTPKKRTVTSGTRIFAEAGQRVLVDLGRDAVGLKGGGIVSIESDEQQGRVLRLTSGTLACSVEPKSRGNPFVVHAGSYRVRVVGTEFSVLFEDNDCLTVAVKQGNVDVADVHGALIERVTAGNSLRVRQDKEPLMSTLSKREDAEIDALLSPLANDVSDGDNEKKGPHSVADGGVRSADHRQFDRPPSPKHPLAPARDKQDAKKSPVSGWQAWVLNGRIDDAAKALEAYVRLAPDDAEAWFLLADCKKRRKSYEAAVSVYKRAIPNISDRAAATARYRAAVILQDKLGAHRDAINFFEQFLSHVGRAHHLRAEAMLRLGLSLRAIGQTARANALLREIAENHGATASAVRAKKLLD